MWQGGTSGTFVGARASPDGGDGAPHPARGGARRRARAQRRRHPQSALGPSVVGGVATAKPFTYVPPQRAAYERAAALGLSHVLYAKSPGGVMASARRTAHWRPIIDRVAKRHGLDASMLEAIVMLESAGRADARASDDLRSAAGLTQILAETGQNLLGLRIDVKTSERLTRGILRGHRVRRREALRRRVDERFDPAKALEATARYLDFAKGKLGRDDLAVVSYHMGVGNLQQALAGYGEGSVPYAQLYFDSSPLRHAAAWRKLSALGDDSSTYLWRVLAAARSCACHRSDPKALARGGAAVPQGLGRGGPAPARAHDGVRRPLRHRPGAGVGRVARDRREVLAPLRAADRCAHGRAGAAHQAVARLYRALRPEALAMLEAMGAATQAIGGTAPLGSRARCATRTTSTSWPRPTRKPPPRYSLHTTGYAFDIARNYRSRAQALAFQFVLDRLTARGLIAWVREPGAIHVTVASGRPR